MRIRTVNVKRRNAHLVMDVVIVGVVAKEGLERVPRDGIPAVVVYRFEGGKSEEERRLADGHVREGLCDRCAKGVEEKSLKRVVIKRPICIGHIRRWCTMWMYL